MIYVPFYSNNNDVVFRTFEDRRMIIVSNGSMQSGKCVCLHQITTAEKELQEKEHESGSIAVTSQGHFCESSAVQYLSQSELVSQVPAGTALRPARDEFS